MTYKNLSDLQELRKNPKFSALTVEQLVYEAVRGSSIDEVKGVLETVNFDRLAERDMAF